MRAAKRLADVMDAPWIAVTVEEPGEQLNDADRRHVDAAMKLARSLGAETTTLAASDLAGELLRFSKFENVTQIVLGRSRGGFLTELLRRSLPHELLRRADGVAVHVITGSKREARRPSRATLPASANLAIAPLVWSTVAVAAAVGVGQVLTQADDIPQHLDDLPDGGGVLRRHLRHLAGGLRLRAVVPGLQPVFHRASLHLYDRQAARAAGSLHLSGDLRRHVDHGRAHPRAGAAGRAAHAATRRLYEFSRRLSGVASYDDIPEAAVAEIHTSVGRPAVVLLSVDGELELRAAWPPEEALDTASMTAARWALEHDEPAGADTATLPAVPWLFLPLKTGRAAFGVVGVGRDEEGATLDPEARTLLDTLAEQTAAALDRASLGREMVAARSAAETERVRNTLLASISHDFRTPLASILGSATSLIDYGDKLGAQATATTCSPISATRPQGLDEMVRNLLAMTRIDAGALEVRRDWVDLREIVAARRRRRAPTRRKADD